jgi:hypothetical protein
MARLRPESLTRPIPDLLLIRLLRRWVAAQSSDTEPLPELVRLADEMERPPELAIALDSLLQLVETCLGRRIVCASCTSPRLAPDERAVLLAIAAAPAPGSDPQGLPGALCWAAAAVRTWVTGERPRLPADRPMLAACP